MTWEKLPEDRRVAVGTKEEGLGQRLGGAKTPWWEGGWTDRNTRFTSVAWCINKVRRA